MALVNLEQGIPVNNPLFFGDKLGLTQNIHVRYPQIAYYRDRAMTQPWRWDEILMDRDMLDVDNPKFEKQVPILIETISFQAAGDSLALRAVADVVGRVVSNHEFEGLLIEWKRHEYIHGYCYTEILRTAFSSRASELLDSIAKNEKALKRALYMGDIFDKTFRLCEVYDNANPSVKKELLPLLQRTVIKFYVMLLCLEAVSFKASFASTFKLIEATNAFTRIGKNIQLIAKDELLHREFNKVILDILRNDPSWKDAFADPEVIEWTKNTIEAVLDMEHEWSEHLFSEGRQIVGLNANLLKDYTKFCSRFVYDAVKLPYPDDVAKVKDNPLPSMEDKWFNMDNIQNATKDIPSNHYRLNVVVDDSIPEKRMNNDVY